MKILIVEDNPTDRKLVHSVLTGAGHEVSDAVSAEEAVEMLETEIPEVILTDLDLPEMDGLAMTHQLKEGTKTSAIPVIAMTSYPDHFSRAAIRAAGFAGYFVKPLNTRTLSQQITAVLRDA